MPVAFHAENTTLPEFNKKQISNWINKVIELEEKIPGEVNYIFTSDKYLLEMNNKYLGHDYYTDIITFDYCEHNSIAGDIFISTDRISDNANIYKVTFKQELLRVIIHGILHLAGHKDASEKEKKAMRQLEEHYLNLLKDQINEF